MNKVYLNGELVPQSAAKISAFDAGFLYGFGAFETMRAYKGVIFRLERHIQRLSKAAEALGLSGCLDILKIKQACCRVMEVNKLKDARIRLSVTAGKTGIPPSVEPSRATVFIAAQHYIPPNANVYRRGYNAIVSTIRCCSKSQLSRLKTSCYLEHLMARREAVLQKADEALLLNERSKVAEGAMSNVFVCSNGRLLTPPVGSGALPGITREVVIEISKQTGIDFHESQLSLMDLEAADEAFITNSIIEIMPLARINGKLVGSSTPGPMTKRLIEAYKKIVANETEDRQKGKPGKRLLK